MSADDIVERLRHQADTHLWSVGESTAREAADEIVSLRAEVERLRSPNASMTYTFDSSRVDCTPVWNAWDERPKWISTEAGEDR